MMKRTRRLERKPDLADEVVVKVNIRPGPVSPAQKQASKRFWGRLIAEAKSEAAK